MKDNKVLVEEFGNQIQKFGLQNDWTGSNPCKWWVFLFPIAFIAGSIYFNLFSVLSSIGIGIVVFFVAMLVFQPDFEIDDEKLQMSESDYNKEKEKLFDIMSKIDSINDIFPTLNLTFQKKKTNCDKSKLRMKNNQEIIYTHNAVENILTEIGNKLKEQQAPFLKKFRNNEKIELEEFKQHFKNANTLGGITLEWFGFSDKPNDCFLTQNELTEYFKNVYKEELSDINNLIKFVLEVERLGINDNVGYFYNSIYSVAYNVVVNLKDKKEVDLVLEQFYIALQSFDEENEEFNTNNIKNVLSFYGTMFKPAFENINVVMTKEDIDRMLQHYYIWETISVLCNQKYNFYDRVDMLNTATGLNWEETKNILLNTSNSKCLKEALKTNYINDPIYISVILSNKNVNISQFNLTDLLNNMLNNNWDNLYGLQELVAVGANFSNQVGNDTFRNVKSRIGELETQQELVAKAEQARQEAQKAAEYQRQQAVAAQQAAAYSKASYESSQRAEQLSRDANNKAADTNRRIRNMTNDSWV